mmetsp:Transcript_42147/g.111316  ORF Transcript_42147/g.111316 Transcript_42147/m.111316 type:complete len:628 (-) Transcript_42147:339-2222(-)
MLSAAGFEGRPLRVQTWRGCTPPPPTLAAAGLAGEGVPRRAQLGPLSAAQTVRDVEPLLGIGHGKDWGSIDKGIAVSAAQGGRAKSVGPVGSRGDSTLRWPDVEVEPRRKPMATDLSGTFPISGRGSSVPPPPHPREPRPPKQEKGKEAQAVSPLRISVGSLGHPHSCAPACRYVKRQGGCREGVLCKQCHQCFWQRRLEVKPELEEVAVAASVSEADGSGHASVDTAISKDVKDDNIEVADASISAGIDGAPISVGTHGHPHTCKQACKYLRRSGGCRDGTKCERCHLCTWRRGLPPKEGFAEKSAEPRAGFAKGSVETLQKLIQLQLFCTEHLSKRPELTCAVDAAVAAKAKSTGATHKADQLGEARGHLTASTLEIDGNETSSAGPAVEEDPYAQVPSVGSINHPTGCGNPCKYYFKRTGCKDGRLCLRCHLCRWHRREPAQAAEGSKLEEATTESGNLRQFTEVPPSTNLPMLTSIGSVGHPYSCQKACKYVRRKGGCRDGEACKLCHHCHWSRMPQSKQDPNEGGVDSGAVTPPGEDPWIPMRHPIWLEESGPQQNVRENEDDDLLESAMGRNFCSVAYGLGLSGLGIEAGGEKPFGTPQEEVGDHTMTPRQRVGLYVVESL